MNDEALLLKAICDNPADDTARLVFADYLQEQGGSVNGAWALFIRGQVGLARLADGEPSDPTATARVRVLDVPYWRAQWFARLGFGFADGRLSCREWVRGFPLAISGTEADVRGAWSRLAGRVPFEKLKVTHATDGGVEDLVARPGLDRVRELGLQTEYFDRDPLGDRTFLALAGCASLSQLREFVAWSAVVSDVGAVAILDSPHLAVLATFSARVAYRHRDAVVPSPDLRERFVRRFGTSAIS